MYSLGSKTDKIILYLGWLSSGITGLGMPSLVFLMGDIIDAYNSYTSTDEEMLDTIKQVCLTLTIIGVVIGATSYCSSTFLAIASERIVKKIKISYLHSIL